MSVRETDTGLIIQTNYSSCLPKSPEHVHQASTECYTVPVLFSCPQHAISVSALHLNIWIMECKADGGRERVIMITYHVIIITTLAHLTPTLLEKI